jgi:hypothetical protein
LESVYIDNKGMARLCTVAYQKTPPHDLKDVFCHLTNYSVNKKNENFRQSVGEDSGHKRSLSGALAELAALGCDVAVLRQRIDDLV